MALSSLGEPTGASLFVPERWAPGLVLGIAEFLLRPSREGRGPLYCLLRCAKTAAMMIAPVSIRRLASGTALMLKILSR